MTDQGRSIFSQYTFGTAIGIALLSLAPHAFLTPQLSLQFASMLVSVIAGVYFGFAVSRGTTVQQLTELAVAMMFGLAAVLGVFWSAWVLPSAYLAHAVWDLAHHNRFRLKLVAIPQWYVPWCATIDAIIGLSLIALWRHWGVL
jgi:hypothetical protein